MPPPRYCTRAPLLPQAALARSTGATAALRGILLPQHWVHMRRGRGTRLPLGARVRSSRVALHKVWVLPF